MDDKCTIYDLNNGDIIVEFGSLFFGLYRLDAYEKCMDEATCTILDIQAMIDTKLWHAHFGHLNFSSLLCLQKSYMVMSLLDLKSLEKHVCEGCILGKMKQELFPNDGFIIRAIYNLQLVHSNIIWRIPIFWEFH